MKDTAYPPSIDKPSYMDFSTPFLKENLDPPFYDFSKFSTLL